MPGQNGTYRTNCHYCGYLCAFNATVEDGRLVELSPDPTRYPYDERILAGCRRWRMNLDMMDHPDRVNYPLRRKGERGSGEWTRVSWDDALNEIADRLRVLAAEHGPETLASMIGGPHTSFWPLHRFMNLFGSPNNMGIGQICWNPRIWMDVLTFGWTVECNLNFSCTDCFILWGTNPAESDNSAFWRSMIQVAKSPDIPFVVIDPRYTKAAALADVWVPIKPGTDCGFALGLLNVIISEDLYDHAFVDEWCYGFDELAEHVKAWAPEHVSSYCDISVEQLYQIARLWGNAEAGALVSGRGIDQVGRNVAPAHRAICCLRAVMGNVDKPGTCILAEGSDFVPEADLELTALLSEEHKARCLNTGRTPLQSYDGLAYVSELTERAPFNRKLPGRYLASAHPDLVLHAMETGEPYPVRALIVEATNPLLTYADTHRVFEALMGLDLIVVLDYFITPTAAIADFVLPSAAAIERATFQAHGGVANIAYGGPRAVDPYYERKNDYEIFRELGLRLGQEEYWPEGTWEDALAATLAPSGMSWEKYCEDGIYHVPPYPFKHLYPDAAGIERGFATVSGKIELASNALEHLGGQRLPEPDVLPSLCSEQLIRNAESAGGVHLSMITGARKQPYNASMYFNNPEFRKKSPYPVAEVSEATAAKYGFVSGQVVTVATDRGEARFVLETKRMRDGLISVDYGWWHPEQRICAPDFGGIWESNINCCTVCDLETGEPMIGTWYYNAIDCVVVPSGESLSYLEGKEA